MIRIPSWQHAWQLVSRRWRRPTTLRVEEIQAVLAHYDLGGWRLAEPLLTGNTVNVALHTGRGKKVLKRYIGPWPHQATEHSILTHLAGLGFPVPNLTLNTSGRTYTEFGDRAFALLDFVEGHAINNYILKPQTHRQCVAQAGDMLARYHQVIAGFIPQGEKMDGFRRDSLGLYRDVAWHLEVLDCVAAARPVVADALDDFLRGISPHLRRDLVAVGRHYEKLDPELPRLPIHADYVPRNLLYWENQIAAVLDFESACVNFRALDVARGLTSFAPAGRSGVDEALAEVFLKAYCARQPLLSTEVKLLPDFFRWRQLRNIVWRVERLARQPHVWSRPQVLATVRARWDENLWMKTHGEQLTQNLRQAVFQS